MANQSPQLAYPKIIGYYTNWSIYDRSYPPTEVPVDKLTHINYAFAKIEDGVIVASDPWADLEKPYDKDPTILGSFQQFNNPKGPIRSVNPNLKVLISVGGWAHSKYFSDVAATESNRVKFSDSVVKFLLEHGFDGVDIDWEFPVVQGHEDNITRPEDGTNFTLLLQTLRHHLDQVKSCHGNNFLITLATSAAKHSYQHIELGKIGQIIDWFNVMTYDFTGPWSNVCHHHNNLLPDACNPNQLSADQALRDYIGAGVPPHKLVMGVPFFGRGFSNVECSGSNNGHQPPHPSLGLGQTYSGAPPGKAEAGVFQYHDLVQSHLTLLHGDHQCHQPQWHRMWNDNLKTVHLWHAGNREFISYDDDQSLAWKCYHVKLHGLGGIMIWELFGDDRNNTLLNAIVKGFSC